MISSFADRFWAKVDASGDCWEWTGARAWGYGLFETPDGRMHRAHRLAWELLVGPIPEGLTIDHLCWNRRCVNPDHLDVVTQRENNLRGHSASGRNARKTHCKWGHPLTGLNLYAINGHRYCRACHCRIETARRRKAEAHAC